MRIYIIGNDGIALSREAPAAPNKGEIVVASNEELHAAPLSGKQLLALWNALPGVEKRKKVGDRAALIDQLWRGIEALPDPEPQPDVHRPSKQTTVIAMLRRLEGATVDEVASATGWQRHTVRGVFSGTLKKKLGRRLPRPKRSVAGSTASPSRRAYETANRRRFGSPALWPAVARSRSRRQPDQPTGRCGHRRGEPANCRTGGSVDARIAACLAAIKSHRTASGAQSRSTDPSPRQSAARANPWWGERGAAATPADFGRRVRERRRALRSRCRAEDRYDIGAPVARTRSHRRRSRGRVRV